MRSAPTPPTPTPEAPPKAGAPGEGPHGPPQEGDTARPRDTTQSAALPTQRRGPLAGAKECWESRGRTHGEPGRHEAEARELRSRGPRTSVRGEGEAPPRARGPGLAPACVSAGPGGQREGGRGRSVGWESTGAVE